MVSKVDSQASINSINGTLFLHRPRTKSSLGTSTVTAVHLKTGSETRGIKPAGKKKPSLQSTSSHLSSSCLNPSTSGMVKRKKNGSKKLKKAGVGSQSGSELLSQSRNLGPKPLIELVKDRTSDQRTTILDQAIVHLYSERLKEDQLAVGGL